jgi:truncated hemoglobin YjbI
MELSHLMHTVQDFLSTTWQSIYAFLKYWWSGHKICFGVVCVKEHKR